MRIFTTLTLLFFIFLALLFCCAEKETVGPSSDNYRFPLQTGNIWEYDRNITLTYDISSGTRPADTTRSTVTVQVIGEEVIFDSLKTIKVRETIVDNQSTQTSDHYYQQKSDGLFLVASLGAPFVLPKRSVVYKTGQEQILFGLSNLMAWVDNSNMQVMKDSLYLEKPAKTVFMYPLKAGTEWKYSEKNKPRRINKRVLGETNVHTDADTFKTVQVRWIVDFDNDGEFDDNIQYIDYIADQGLVKRSFLIQNLPVVDDDGAYIGKYNYHDLSVLTFYKLNE